MGCWVGSGLQALGGGERPHTPLIAVAAAAPGTWAGPPAGPAQPSAIRLEQE